jgi:hypothetical protein
MARRAGWRRQREVGEEAQGGRWLRSGESAPERLNPERSRAVTWWREESHEYPWGGRENWERERDRSRGKKKKESWISYLSLFVWVVVTLFDFYLFDFWLFSNGSTGEWESREHEREMHEEEEEGRRRLGIVWGERRETIFFFWIIITCWEATVLPKQVHEKWRICCGMYFVTFFQIFLILGNRTTYRASATSVLRA